MGNDVDLEGEFTRDDIAALAARGAIGKLSITKRKTPFAEPVASALRELASVEDFWLWCDVSRDAMTHALALPGLRELNVLLVREPGQTGGAAAAGNLRVLRVNLGLSEADLVEIAHCPALAELGAQSCQLTMRALDALLAMPTLESLDIEDTPFDDAMAAQVAHSTTLHTLDCGNTKLTGKGLAALCRMPQLRSLDLWATHVALQDLDRLVDLPNLDYLSLGHPVENKAPRIDGVMALLDRLPTLRRIWLDGIALDDATRKTLEARYTYVRITT